MWILWFTYMLYYQHFLSFQNSHTNLSGLVLLSFLINVAFLVFVNLSILQCSNMPWRLFGWLPRYSMLLNFVLHRVNTGAFHTWLFKLMLFNGLCVFICLYVPPPPTKAWGSQMAINQRMTTNLQIFNLILKYIVWQMLIDLFHKTCI